MSIQYGYILGGQQIIYVDSQFKHQLHKVLYGKYGNKTEGIITEILNKKYLIFCPRNAYISELIKKRERKCNQLFNTIKQLAKDNKIKFQDATEKGEFNYEKLQTGRQIQFFDISENLFLIIIPRHPANGFQQTKQYWVYDFETQKAILLKYTQRFSKKQFGLPFLVNNVTKENEQDKIFINRKEFRKFLTKKIGDKLCSKVLNLLVYQEKQLVLDFNLSLSKEVYSLTGIDIRILSKKYTDENERLADSKGIKQLDLGFDGVIMGPKVTMSMTDENGIEFTQEIFNTKLPN